MLRPYILMLFLLNSSAFANCPSRPFNYPSTLRIEEPAVLIVTHAASGFDARIASKRGVDEAVAFARRSNIPVVYLEDDDQPETYFARECEPDYRILSEGGELPLDIHAGEVYVVGGHLEMCLSQTLHDVLLSWSHHAQPRQRMTFFMDGIYSNGKSIQAEDPYYESFSRFMNIVTYGRPGGETWPKLTLLETLGVIAVPDQIYDYLQRVLPHYARTLPPSYRVELVLNDEAPRVLQKGSGRKAPLFQFHFVDSALTLDDEPGKPAPSKAQPRVGATADK